MIRSDVGAITLQRAAIGARLWLVATTTSCEDVGRTYSCSQEQSCSEGDALIHEEPILFLIKDFKLFKSH